MVMGRCKAALSFPNAVGLMRRSPCWLMRAPRQRAALMLRFLDQPAIVTAAAVLVEETLLNF
jgi:hypothetical protein